MRIAFYGRAANPEWAETALRRQRTMCEAMLSPWDEIVAVFIDVTSAAARTPSTGLPPGVHIDRDGGLADLLGEAANPYRRFDAVAIASPDRLARKPAEFLRIVGAMAAVELTLIVPELLRPAYLGWIASVVDEQ